MVTELKVGNSYGASNHINARDGCCHRMGEILVVDKDPLSRLVAANLMKRIKSNAILFKKNSRNFLSESDPFIKCKLTCVV
jgi:hypothetical protein